MNRRSALSRPRLVMAAATLLVAGSGLLAGCLHHAEKPAPKPDAPPAPVATPPPLREAPGPVAAPATPTG